MSFKFIKPYKINGEWVAPHFIKLNSDYKSSSLMEIWSVAFKFHDRLIRPWFWKIKEDYKPFIRKTISFIESTNIEKSALEHIEALEFLNTFIFDLDKDPEFRGSSESCMLSSFKTRTYKFKEGLVPEYKFFNSVFDEFRWIEPANTQGKKLEIKAFYDQNSRLPSVYSVDITEKRLAKVLYNYLNVNSNSYCEAFRDWWKTLPSATDEIFEAVKQFYTNYNRLPNRKSENSDERKLAWRVDQTTKINSELNNYVAQRKTKPIKQKLDYTKALEIRTSTKSARELSTQYEVSISTIRDILKNRTFRS